MFKSLEVLSDFIFNQKFGATPEDEVKFSKKLCKMYKAMTYMEKMKHLDPHMSLAIKGLVKPLFNELKEMYGNRSLDKSL